MIKLPYLQIVRDRYGVQRAYMRRPGYKRVRVEGEIGSTEFIKNYGAVRAAWDGGEGKEDYGGGSDVERVYLASLTPKERRALRDDSIIRQGLSDAQDRIARRERRRARIERRR